MPRYQPVTWANDDRPPSPWFEAEAAIVAVSEARARGWIQRF